MNKKVFLLALILLAMCINAFAFKGVLKVFTNNDGDSDIDTPYIYYFDDIYTNFGGKWQQPINAHKGQQYFLQSQKPPTDAGYIAEFHPNIAKKDAGEFYLMASMIPMAVAHGSPVQIYVDGEMVRDYITNNKPVEVGNKAYGVSNALKWCNFGTIKLDAGEHNISFVVRTDTALTKGMYVQGYDCFALVKYVPMPKPKWEDAEVPLFYKNIKPQEKPIYSYWVEAEDSKNHNISNIDVESCYNGKQLLIQNQKTDNYAEFEIDVDKAGKYLIMGATGPVGALFVSPLDLYVDDYLMESFSSRPHADLGWGYSSTLRWVSYGIVDLTADTHTFKFTCYKNRQMDNNVIQSFDALALVDADMLNIKINVTPDTQDKIIAKPKDKINISLKPVLTKTNIDFPIDVPLNIKLMKEGYKIKDNMAQVKIDPENVNKPLDINFEMEVPFDVCEGDYYLECDNLITPKDTHLLDFSFSGKYTPPAQKSLVADNLSITGGTIKAGEPYNFKMTADLKAPADSEILTVIFEQSKDVAYYAVSVPVPGLKGATGPFSADLSFTLPAEMPKGKVKGLLSLDGDISSSTPVDFNIDSKYTNQTTNMKPLSYGFFKDSTGMTQVWYSNQAHSLYWNGKPWMKVSAMFNGPYMSFSSTEQDFEGFKENVQKLKNRGIYHIYLFTQGPMSSINVEKWGTIMDYLEQEGFTYVIGFPNGAGKSVPLPIKQIRANPDKAKIDKNVTGLHKRTLKGAEFDMGNRKINAVYCGALDAQGNIIAVKEADITFIGADFVETEVNFGQNPVDIVYIPEYLSEWSTDNPWADFKVKTEETSRFIKTANLRPGFRGFVDLIMSNERGLYNSVEPIFINSPEFLKERERQLTEKYKNINALKKAWLVKGDFVKTIGEAATLYPVYNNGDLIFLTCDVEKGKNPVYKIDAQSPYWYEYLDLRDISYGDFEDRMIDKIKEVCDAPVNIKLCGMPEFYDYAREANRHGIDGVGCETYATGEGHITYNVGYRYVEMETAKKNMIGYSTEMGRGWADDMYPNWPDIHALFYDLGVTHYLGSRITYLFLYDVLPQTLYERNRISRDPRMMEWMNLWQEILDDKTEYIANYKPEIYTSWPRPDAWWPSCSERRAVRETSDAYGVNQVKCPNGVWAVPTCDPFTKSKVTFITLNDNPGVDYYKEDFEKLLKLGDREIVMLGHRKNLGALSVDKYYTDKFVSDDKYEYQGLIVPDGGDILEETNGIVWAMKVGKLQIIAAYPKKKFNALEDLVKYAILPEAQPDRVDASGFLEKGLGMTFATFGNNAFKAIGYTLKGQDVCVLHTTQKPGNINVGFTASKDCTFTVPYINFVKDMKAGETVVVTLPESDVNNQSQGAGMGYIKIIGEKLEDLQFTGITMDTLPKASKSGYEVSGLPAGMELPKPTRPEQFSVNTIEMMKAKAGFDTAVDEYNTGSYANAQQYLEEYLPLAGAELAVPFNVFLGNVHLMRGKIDEAIKYYNIALEKAPGLGDAMTGLGCALYNTDKDKAIALWQGANTEEAKHNLEVAGK